MLHLPIAWHRQFDTQLVGLLVIEDHVADVQKLRHVVRRQYFRLQGFFQDHTQGLVALHVALQPSQSPIKVLPGES